MPKFLGVDFSGLQIGAIVSVGHDAISPSMLLCDGSAVSRTTYAALFAQIGVSWGSGDGTTTFNIPDLRGKFLRGTDTTGVGDPDFAGRSPTNAGGNSTGTGSSQSHQLGSHSHGIFTGGHGHSGQSGGHGSDNAGGQRPYGSNNSGGYGNGNWVNGVGDLGGGTYGAGGNESRPLNSSVQYAIVFA